MRLLRRSVLLAPLAAAALVAVWAGGTTTSPPAQAAATPAPARPVAATGFPKGASLTYAAVRKKYGRRLAFAPGSSMITKGVNRVPFLVLDEDAKVVGNAAVAIYTMRNDGTGVQGPYTAAWQPFGIRPAFLSRTSAADPDFSKAFYVAHVRFPAGKPTAIFALARVGGRLQATSATTLGLKLGKGEKPPPAVGDRAIPVHTLTADDIGGDWQKATTREPPDKDLLQVDFADVLGRKPTVLMFATPALCQSRVCGPDVDVAEQVKAGFGNRVAWVHQEIYVDNVVDKGVRPQVAKWRLPTEPWLFIVDRRGTIVARVEGAISVPELTALVRKAL